MTEDNKVVAGREFITRLRSFLIAERVRVKLGFDDYRIGYRKALETVQRWLEENTCLLTRLYSFLTAELTAIGSPELIGHDDYRIGYREAIETVQRWLEENS